MAVGLDCDEELDRLRSGGSQAVAEMFARYREKLLRMITLRLDGRLLSKVDGEDVLQEAFLISDRRINDYLQEPSVPFFVWLRQITSQVLVDVHRRYLGAQMRDVRQELAVLRADGAAASSASLVAHLPDSLTSPSQCAVRSELVDEMHAALRQLAKPDREVLVLRHLEALSNGEVAEILGIDKYAASKRYLRALARLQSAMGGHR